MITVCKDNNDYVLVGSKDKRFREAWGEVNRCSSGRLIDTMNELTDWCNNTLKEECLFEVGG